MNFKQAPALLAALIAPTASVQTPTLARVAVTHNDADGIISPGESILLSTVVSWGDASIGNQGHLAGVRGSTVVTAPMGAQPGGSSVVLDSDFTQGGLIHLGTPVNGSMMGADIALTAPFFQGGWMIPPGWNHLGILIHTFEWTAPNDSQSVGTYSFAFVPPAIAPNVRVYRSVGTPAFIELPTMHAGTSITVVPAPSALYALLVVVTPPRRRRPS